MEKGDHQLARDLLADFLDHRQTINGIILSDIWLRDRIFETLYPSNDTPFPVYSRDDFRTLMDIKEL